MSRASTRDPRDPWGDAPVGELQEQLLPRWFVLLAVVAVPLAVVAVVAAFLSFGPDDVPLVERRPPPEGALTHDVGDYRVGDAQPVAYEQACETLAGVRVAGTEGDRAVLRQAIAGLCNTPVEPPIAEALSVFASSGGVVRFGLFELTGVDSAADVSAEPPRILVNTKFTQAAQPRWVAPLIAHDAVLLAGDPGSAETALAARRAEDAVCEALLTEDEQSRGCEDAAGILALPDPLAALRDAGYR